MIEALRRAALLFVLLGRAFAARQAFSPDDLWLWRQADDPRISPDGQTVVYKEIWRDRDRDACWSNLWIASADGKARRQWTDGAWRDTSPRWSPDAQRVAFISDRTGAPQIFVRPLAREAELQITRVEYPPLSMGWSGDGKFLAFIARVPADLPPPSWAPAAILPFIRRPVEGYLQIFVVPSSGGTPRRITRGNFDWLGEPVWMPDGRSILAAREGRLEALAVSDGSLRTLASGSGRYSSVQPSPDGARIAFLFAESKPQSYTLQRLFVMNADGARVRTLAGNLDRDPANPQWSSDSRTVYFLAGDRGATGVYAARNDGTVRQAPRPPERLSGFSLADNGRAVSVRSAASAAGEVVSFAVDVVSPEVTIAAPNQGLLAGREIAAVESIEYPSEGRTIQAWLVKPSPFDPARKYPLFLDIQDDPRSMCGVEFRLRAQILAARGFAVLCANPRGTPGYGEQFGNLLRSRYPGDDFDDLMRGVEFVLNGGYVDPRRLAVSGGLLAAWAIGHTDRFHTAIARRPIGHWVTDIATAPDGFRRATEWMGAMPWDDPEQYARHSPVMFAQNFKTPTLVLAGNPDPGSDELYFALQARKVDSALVRLPATGRPSELVLELETILAWLARDR